MKTNATVTSAQVRAHCLDIARENAHVIIKGSPKQRNSALTYLSSTGICRFDGDLVLGCDANCGAVSQRMVGITIPPQSVLLTVQGDETRGNVYEIALLTPESIETMPTHAFSDERILSLIEATARFLQGRDVVAAAD